MLTTKTKSRLTSALTRKTLANEFEALLSAPAAPSVKLQAAIKAMMANKAAANEVIAALTTGGYQALSGQSTRFSASSPNAARRFLDAIARKPESNEITALL